MTNINNYFPQGDYIKADTLQGREIALTIAGVEQVQYQDGTTAPALSFQNTDKKLGLNKTNAMRIAELHGEETESWIGKQITIMPDKTEFQGKIVDCVRVKFAMAAPSVAAAQAAVPVPGTFQQVGAATPPLNPGAERPEDAAAALNDEVPF